MSISRKSAVVIALSLGAAAIVTFGISGLGDKTSPRVAAATVVAPMPSHTYAAFTEPAPGKADERQLVLFDAAKGTTSAIGAIDRYSDVRWSPSGTLLAALATPDGPNQPTVLHLVTPSTGADKLVRLSSEAESSLLAWRPDGSELAILGQHILLLRSDGTQIADIPLRPVPNTPQDVQQFYTGGYGWSPDGSLFGTIINGDVVVVSTTGSSRVRPLVQAIPGLKDPTDVVFSGWQGNDHLVLQPFSGISSGSVANAAQAWVVPASSLSQATDEAVAGLQFTRIAPDFVDAATQAIVEQYSDNGSITWQQRSADGKARVFDVRPAPVAVVTSAPAGTAKSASSDATGRTAARGPSPTPSGTGRAIGGQVPTSSTLVVVYEGQGGAIRLPDVATDTHDGMLVDVVVVGS